MSSGTDEKTATRQEPPDPEGAATRVEYSIRKYRRAHRRYERNHPEIFNPIEQARLRDALEAASNEIESQGTGQLKALDLGCGTGNVTRHLLDLGFDVLAADVSPEFLREIEKRYGRTGRVTALRLNGQDLSGVPTGSVDMVCAYSVLHHIPDYLSMVEEVCRVLRPGGTICLDHEAIDTFYDKDGCFWDLLREVEQHRIKLPGWDPHRRRWQRYLMPSKYATRIRQIFDPGYPWNVEGDIHVWESDRIEWDRIEERLARAGCEVLLRSDYLAYSAEYPREIYERYEGRCTNMRLLVARRSSGAASSGEQTDQSHRPTGAS